jgi:hypothetical protein
MILRKKCLIIATVTMFVFSFLTSNYPVNAIDSTTKVKCSIPDKAHPEICQDDYYSGNNISFYDPNAVPCSATAAATSSGPLVGNDNPEKIFNYLTGKGLTAAQAAGFLGNIKDESGYNPNAQEPGMVVPDNTMPTEGRGFGIIQWSFTPRQGPLVALAKATNRDTTDLSLQLDYLWKEITDPALYKGQHWENALANLKATNDPVEAARSIHYDYERSGAWPGFPASRGVVATEWFNKLKNNTNTATTTTATTSQCGTSAGIGDYMSADFKLFNQCDAPWGKLPVPSPDGTACQVACGPTSVAMMVVNMTGQNVTPTDTINFVTQNNLWYGTGGTTMQTNKQLIENWQLKAELVPSTVGLDDIKAILDKGGLVMMSGRGAVPYLDSINHYVIIKGITADNKFSIADPNGKSGEYDTGTIIASIRAVGLGGVAAYKK